MDDKEKKSLKILIIVLVVFLILTIALSILKKANQKEDKVLDEYAYIIEKETDYSINEDKGLLPLINLKGSEVEKANAEIIDKYYEVSYTKKDTFKYEYSTYKDILSLFITITYVDNSEYGRIEYYVYNVNTKTNDVLTNEELFKDLGLDSTDIKDTINSRIKEYYNMDNLRNELSLDEYKKAINYSEENNKIIIREDKLYCYMMLNPTQSLISYQGNINQIELTKLK